MFAASENTVENIGLSITSHVCINEKIMINTKKIIIIIIMMIIVILIIRIINNENNNNDNKELENNEVSINVSTKK